MVLNQLLTDYNKLQRVVSNIDTADAHYEEQKKTAQRCVDLFWKKWGNSEFKATTTKMCQDLHLLLHTNTLNISEQL